MKTPWYYILALCLAIAVLVTFLYLVRQTLPPFIIAFAIAWLLDPLLDRLYERKVPRLLAISAVYLVFLGVFVIGLIFLVPAIIEQAKQLGHDLPGYAERARVFVAHWMQSHQAVLIKFKLPTTLHEVFSKYGSQVSDRAASAVQLGGNWIAANLSKALWIILIPLAAFYFLVDFDRIKGRSILFIPAKWRDRTAEILVKVGSVFSNYARGLIIVCLLYGVTTTIVLSAFHLKYGIIIGLVSGVLYAVPFLGALLITLLVFVVDLAAHGFGHALFMAGVMVVLNQLIFDMFVTPKIVGKSVGLHPVLSLFALMAGGQLFGLAGMVLAVPIAASIQEVILELNPELRQQPKSRKAHTGSRPRKRPSAK